jgi:hypothetical protein
MKAFPRPDFRLQETPMLAGVLLGATVGFNTALLVAILNRRRR